MALIQCPECKHNVSDMAAACLYCGYPLAEMGKRQPRFPPRISFFIKLWRGEYSLSAAFWLYFFTVFFTVNTAIYAFPQMIIRVLLPPTYGGILLSMAAFIIYALYLLTCVAGVWRSAYRYKGAKVFALSARVFVICYAFSSLYLTTLGFIFPLLTLLKFIN